MSIADYVIILLISAGVIKAVLSIYRQKKRGGCFGCGGSCASCNNQSGSKCKQ